MVVTEPILLSSGRLHCQIAPDLGGAILGMQLDGRHFLRATPQATSAAESAGFAMLPFCNRIAGGAVRMGEQAWAIEPNFGTPPMPCHGDGWQSAWAVRDRTANSVLLSLASRFAPYTYSAQQRIALENDGLHIALSVVNEGDVTLPFGVGFHPYFPDPDRAAMQFAAQRFWLEGPDKLPTEPISLPPELDASLGLPVSPHWRNNSYDGWSREALIDWDDGRRMRMSATGLGVLHIYRPEGQAFFCLEAQSHVSGAAGWSDGTEHGMVALAPGESIDVSLRLAPSMR